MINLCKLAEQQKDQRVLKIKNKILKQTHDVKLAECLSLKTEKINEVNESTEKLGEIMKESNSEINKVIVNDKIKNCPLSFRLQETLKSFAKESYSLELNQDKEVKMSNLGVPVISLGGDKLQVNDNIYELTPQKHKALSLTSYTGKSMKNEKDQRTSCNFLVDVGYTGEGDKKSNQKKLFTGLFNSFEIQAKRRPIIYKEK